MKRFGPAFATLLFASATPLELQATKANNPDAVSGLSIEDFHAIRDFNLKHGRREIFSSLYGAGWSLWRKFDGVDVVFVPSKDSKVSPEMLLIDLVETKDHFIVELFEGKLTVRVSSDNSRVSSPSPAKLSLLTQTLKILCHQSAHRVSA